jgi:hypothetical protein
VTDVFDRKRAADPLGASGALPNRSQGPHTPTPRSTPLGPVATTSLKGGAIIDVSPGGLPSAREYYQMYKIEPSVDSIFLDVGGQGKISTLDTNDDVTFENVLNLINDFCTAHPERNLVIVAHSSPKGLVMPIARGSASAQGEILEQFSGVGEVVRDEEKINPQSLDDWKALLRRAEGGAAFNLAPGRSAVLQNVADARALFEEWLRLLQTQFGMNKDKIKQLIRLRDRVRGHALKRVEMRCCWIGKERDALLKLGNFLRPKVITGPVVETFFVRGAITHVRPPEQFQAQLTHWAPIGSWLIENGVALHIEEDPGAFRYHAVMVGHTLDKIKEWVLTRIGPGYNGTTRPTIGGLRNRAGAVPNVFPSNVLPNELIFANDRDYTRQLISLTLSG